MIDFLKINSKVNPSSGIDYKEIVGRLPKPAPAPEIKQPEPIKQIAPLENAQNLFAGKGFQAIQKTIAPTPKPTPLYQSKRDPFEGLSMPPVDIKTAQTTPTIDLTAQGPLSATFGAIRATSDLASLALSVPMASIDRQSTVKGVIKSTIDMAKADQRSGGTASIETAARNYLEPRKIGQYGGESPNIKDIAVIAGLGVAHIFGDLAIGTAEIKGIKESVKFASQFKKIKTATQEFPKSTLPKAKFEFDLGKNTKIIINRDKKSVTIKGYIRRGTNGDVLNSPSEIKNISDGIAEATGKEIIPSIKGGELTLIAKPGIIKPGVTQGINFAKEAQKIISAPTEQALSFSGQEIIKPQIKTPEAPVIPLDFNKPSVSVQKTVVDSDPVLSQVKSVAINSGFRDVVISDKPITDLINNQPAPSGVDLINKTIKINPALIKEDLLDISNGKPVKLEFANQTVTNENDYINALVNFEKQHLKNVTVEDMQNLRSGDPDLIQKTLVSLDERAQSSYAKEFGIKQVSPVKIQKEVSAPKKVIKKESVVTTEKGGDVGEYTSKEPRQSTLKTIETPEQYRLAKSISPDIKFILKTSSRFNGYFRPEPGKEAIAMNRKLYKKAENETPEEYQRRISKTVSHEIGHLIDYMPDQVMSRGNLIGRLLVVSKFKKNFVDDQALLDKRDSLMRKINKINNDEIILDKLKGELTAPLHKELTELNQKIRFNNPVFKKELIKLSHEWKPWTEGVDPNYDAYRKSAAELYADFNSVLFNDPALAQEIAPRFYDEFFISLGKKPEVEKAFLGIQAELMGDKTSLMDKRYQMLKESGQNAAGRFASLVAERETLNKKPWLDAILKEGWYQHAWTRKKSPVIQNQLEILDRGFNNELFVWTEKNIKPITDKLKEANLGIDDLDAVLKLERIAKDITREDVANVKGLDIKTANDVLTEISKILGKEKADVLMSQAAELRAALKELQLKFPDLWTDEQKKLMESNDFYAPFNVLFKESNNIGYYIKQSKGNIDKDFNAFVNTLLRARAVSHYGAKNDIKKTVIDQLLSEGAGDIKKAEVTRIPLKNGQVQRNVKKPQPGWGVVDIKRNGKIESYYLPEDIASSLNQDNLGTLSSILKPFRAVTKPFKQLYTGIINPGFQVVNFLFRDWGTTSMFFGPEWTRAQEGKSNKNVLDILANNTYRNIISKFNQANYYIKAFKNIKEKNLYRKYTPIVEEALKNHVIEVDASGMYKIDTKDLTDQEQAGIKYILQSVGLIEKGTKWQEFASKAQGLAQSFEETPKLAAYMYMKNLGVVDDTNLSTIRNYVGSPNFWKQARENKNISSVFMFYNPIIRGVENLGKKAFVKDAAGKGSRAAFWFRMMRKAIIPALIGVAAEEGFFGDDAKREYELLPEYLKGNYLNIPFGIDKNGKVVSLSIPMDEDARMLHSITRNIARIALHSGDKETRTRALVDILAYTGGQVPGTTPAINIARTWTTAMSGGNPYDSFRRQHIFLANEERLPKIEKAKILAKWTLNQSGMLKLNIHDSVDNRTLTEQTISYTPVVNRFLRISNRGDYEADQAIVRTESEKAAMELMQKKKVVNDLVVQIHENPAKDVNAQLLALAKDRLGEEASDSKKLLKEFKLLNSAMQEEYLTNFGDIHYRSIINQSNDVKKKVVLNLWEKEKMNKKEFVNFVVTSTTLNILSKELAADILISAGLDK